jgi:GT2 family glycosyltransferase
MMFDKTFYETVGDIDESYFMYFEDSDWSLRAARAGVKLYYDPKVILWHKNAQSSNGPGSVLHQKYQRKNRVKFALKYAPIKSRIHVLKNYLIGR